jgi:NADH-quinone oxidoreductase subunit C
MADEPKPDAKTPATPAAPPTPKGPPQAPSEPWQDDVTRLIREKFGDQVLEFSTQLGQPFLVVRPEAAVPVLELLKSQAGFDYLVDVTAVDYPKRAERFDLVYIVYSFSRNQRIRVKTRIPDGFRPLTAVGVHLTANWLEREVFDMFGIEFDRHPDLRRILLPEDWDGYPLRKDYSILRQDQAWVREHLGIESGQ